MDPLENPTGPAPKENGQSLSPIVRLIGGVLLAGITGGITTVTAAWGSNVTDWKKLVGIFGGGFVTGVGLYLKQSPLKA